MEWFKSSTHSHNSFVYVIILANFLQSICTRWTRTTALVLETCLLPGFALPAIIKNLFIIVVECFRVTHTQSISMSLKQLGPLVAEEELLEQLVISFQELIVPHSYTQYVYCEEDYLTLPFLFFVFFNLNWSGVTMSLFPNLNVNVIECIHSFLLE